jgi:uncharacterized protein GlcG (DUF336 family)
LLVQSVPQNIAILDPSAWLVGFVRMDNAFLGSIVRLAPIRTFNPFANPRSTPLTSHTKDIAQKKAKTAVFYNGIPSDGIKKRAEPGGDIYAIQETNGGTVVFGGGLPIYDNEG